MVAWLALMLSVIAVASSLAMLVLKYYEHPISAYLAPHLEYFESVSNPHFGNNEFLDGHLKCRIKNKSRYAAAKDVRIVIQAYCNDAQIVIPKYEFAILRVVNGEYLLKVTIPPGTEIELTCTNRLYRSRLPAEFSGESACGSSPRVTVIYSEHGIAKCKGGISCISFQPDDTSDLKLKDSQM